MRRDRRRLVDPSSGSGGRVWNLVVYGHVAGGRSGLKENARQRARKGPGGKMKENGFTSGQLEVLNDLFMEPIRELRDEVKDMMKELPQVTEDRIAQHHRECARAMFSLKNFRFVLVILLFIIGSGGISGLLNALVGDPKDKAGDSDTLILDRIEILLEDLEAIQGGGGVILSLPSLSEKKNPVPPVEPEGREKRP